MCNGQEFQCEACNKQFCFILNGKTTPSRNQPIPPGQDESATNEEKVKFKKNDVSISFLRFQRKLNGHDHADNKPSNLSH